MYVFEKPGRHCSGLCGNNNGKPQDDLRFVFPSSFLLSRLTSGVQVPRYQQGHQVRDRLRLRRQCHVSSKSSKGFSFSHVPICSSKPIHAWGESYKVDDEEIPNIFRESAEKWNKENHGVKETGHHTAKQKAEHKKKKAEVSPFTHI